jgi:hypothetical protein
MARIAQGKEVLKQAMELLFSARTAKELRQAQAVVLPLKFGFSLEDKKGSHGGRRRQNMSYEEEVAFLAPFFEKASQGGILIVGIIKEELDKRLGRNTALASAYNLLHRHGWRKLAPDTHHPQADHGVQEEWKKNSPNSLPKLTGNGRKKGRSG